MTYVCDIHVYEWESTNVFYKMLGFVIISFLMKISTKELWIKTKIQKSPLYNFIYLLDITRVNT